MRMPLRYIRHGYRYEIPCDGSVGQAKGMILGITSGCGGSVKLAAFAIATVTPIMTKYISPFTPGHKQST